MTVEAFCWSPTVGEANTGAVVTLSASWAVIHAGPVAVGVQPGVTIIAPVYVGFRGAFHHRTDAWLAMDVHTNISLALWVLSLWVWSLRVREWGTSNSFLLELYRTTVTFDSQHHVLV